MAYYPKNLENFRSMDYDSLLYCKTNIGGYFFDGFLNVQHKLDLEVTSHTVESGSSISDHSYMKPKNLEMTIIMSDVHESLIPGQFSGSWSRSVKAFEVLKKIQSDRMTVSVLTRLGLYENMLIQSLTVEDTDEQLWGLRCTVSLVELPVARVRTVEISLADQTTINTEMGNVSASYLNDSQRESILYMISGWLGGSR